MKKDFTSILSFPRVCRPSGVWDLFLLKKENDRFPTTALGNDSKNNYNNRSRIKTFRDDGKKTYNKAVLKPHPQKIPLDFLHTNFIEQSIEQ